MGTRRVSPLWADVAEPLALAAVVAVLGIGIYALWTGALLPSDFQSFYDSARALTSGRDPYLTSGEVVQNLNPPAFIVIFTPIASLPRWYGAVVWSVLNIVALIVSLRIIAHQVPGMPAPPRLVLIVLGFAGTQAQLLLGQTSWLLMLPATLSWRAFRRGHPIQSGLWLGLLIGLKPLFLPVLGVLVLRRQSRALLAATGAVAATVLVGAWGCGWTGYASWLRVGASVDWFALPLNASLLGILSRVADGIWARPLWLVASFGVLVFAGWRLLERPSNTDRDLAVALLTSLVVSPLGWIYYLPVAAGPLFAASRTMECRWWMWSGLACLFWPTGLGWVSSVAEQVVLTPWNAVVGSVYAVGLLTLWWIIVRATPVRPPADCVTRLGG